MVSATASSASGAACRAGLVKGKIPAKSTLNEIGSASINHVIYGNCHRLSTENSKSSTRHEAAVTATIAKACIWPCYETRSIKSRESYLNRYKKKSYRHKCQACSFSETVPFPAISKAYIRTSRMI